MKRENKKSDDNRVKSRFIQKNQKSHKLKKK
jgi:hypothetical protein